MHLIIIIKMKKTKIKRLVIKKIQIINNKMKTDGPPHIKKM